MNEKLFPHEWLAVISGLVVLLGFCSIAYFYEQEVPEEIKKLALEKTKDQIEVWIEGAVEKPGTYALERGAILQDLFNQAVPAADANLRVFNLANKLRNKQKIKVSKSTITIYLEGAVNTPGALILPFGSRLEEIIARAEFPEDADLKPLKKKRKLKDQEVILISWKK